MTAEEYIKAYTRGCSNEFGGGYREWLTPENALVAVELAKKNGCKYAYLHCDKDSFVFEWYKRLGFKYYGHKQDENGLVPMYMEL